MIFTSIGLLVVAAILLFVGIAKSSLAPLIVSLLCTLGAGGVLYASFVYYRKKAIEDGLIPAPEGAPGYPLAYAGAGAAPTPAVVPAGTQPQTQTAWTPAPPDGNGHGNGNGNAPIDGWDDLNAQQGAQVAGTLNLEELHALRRYEVEHANRKTVLRVIDDRIQTIVSVRRDITT